LYYIRGDKADYDAWERLGNPGWNWQSLVPYFLRSEKFTFPTDAQHSAGISYNPCYHGDKGQLNIGFPYQVENSSFYDSARESCEKLGFHLNKDLNGGNVRGFGLFPKTLDRDANVRESAARAYYEPIDSRPNLQVIQGTVQRLLFRDGSESKLIASGVEYTDIQGKLKCLTANKEVIISSGTYGSPVILEASGIGNPRYAMIDC
jgi:choline dehydrogenase